MAARYRWVMPGKGDMSGVNLLGLAQLILVVGAVLVPLLFGRRGGSGGDAGDEPGDGGGGGGPGGPRRKPDKPRGGIPLADAIQSRTRLRDHRRLTDRLTRRPRREIREPERTPARAPRPG